MSLTNCEPSATERLAKTVAGQARVPSSILFGHVLQTKHLTILGHFSISIIYLNITEKKDMD